MGLSLSPFLWPSPTHSLSVSQNKEINLRKKKKKENLLGPFQLYDSVRPGSQLASILGRGHAQYILCTLEAIIHMSILYIMAGRGGAMPLNRSPNTCLNYTFASFMITLSGSRKNRSWVG